MLAHDYATAVAKHLEEGKEFSKTLASLDRILSQKGHEKLRPRILAELAHTFEGHTERGAVVIVGKQSDIETFSSEIKKAEKELGVEEKTKTVVDPSLVGGFVLRTQDAQIDRSYKRALINLYRSIITK